MEVDGKKRPFGVFDMLWAHGLSYLALGPLVYAFSLVPMILAAFVGAWLCRRAAVATAAPTAASTPTRMDRGGDGDRG